MCDRKKGPKPLVSPKCLRTSVRINHTRSCNKKSKTALREKWKHPLRLESKDTNAIHSIWSHICGIV